MSLYFEARSSVPALTADRSPCHRCGCLHLLLSTDPDGPDAEAIHEHRPEFGKGPMNMFVNVPAYPPADFKGVVRSNFDTLYSIAWLDLTKEPLVISAPDTRPVLSSADA